MRVRARQRPWCARMASGTRHHKIRVGDLCLAVPGSHRASPGDPGGALYGRRTVTTRQSARTRSPVEGKGLRARCGIIMRDGADAHGFGRVPPEPLREVRTRHRKCRKRHYYLYSSAPCLSLPVPCSLPANSPEFRDFVCHLLKTDLATPGAAFRIPLDNTEPLFD